MRRYVSEDNDRWAGFEHRPGDIVISTRSKCGTTWLQMITALVVFGERELPAPLAEISPWLDWSVEPADVVRDRLDRQVHRRIIKTHTPLDGLPLDSRATYVVAGRQPLDVAVSLYHHGRNIDRQRFAELSGTPQVSGPIRPLDEWVWAWLDADWEASAQLDTLSGLVHHVDDAWRRRDRGDAEVVLVHFQDLLDDLEGEMRCLANRLGLEVPTERWTDLVEAASFASMRARSQRTVPDRHGVLADAARFFRSGRSGEGRAVLGADHIARYEERIGELASVRLAAWLDPDSP